jgi:hypothetical protein
MPGPQPWRCVRHNTSGSKEPIEYINRGCGKAGCIGVVVVFNQVLAGPDRSEGRKALAHTFHRAPGGAVHNVYYYEPLGFTDQSEYMRFDSDDTTIVRIPRPTTGCSLECRDGFVPPRTRDSSVIAPVTTISG